MAEFDLIDEVSKYDDHGNDGHMCRLTFSQALSSLQERILDLQDHYATNEDGERIEFGLTGVLKAERNRALYEAANLVYKTHQYYLFKEPEEFYQDPKYAELTVIPTMEEWEDMKKDKWNENRRKEAYKNLEKAVMQKHQRQLAFEKEQEEQAQKSRQEYLAKMTYEEREKYLEQERQWEENYKKRNDLLGREPSD